MKRMVLTMEFLLETPAQPVPQIHFEQLRLVKILHLPHNTKQWQTTVQIAMFQWAVPQHMNRLFLAVMLMAVAKVDKYCIHLKMRSIRHMLSSHLVFLNKTIHLH
jgi:hypothetical protein